MVDKDSNRNKLEKLLKLYKQIGMTPTQQGESVRGYAVIKDDYELKGILLSFDDNNLKEFKEKYVNIIRQLESNIPNLYINKSKIADLSYSILRKWNELSYLSEQKKFKNIFKIEVIEIEGFIDKFKEKLLSIIKECSEFSRLRESLNLENQETEYFLKNDLKNKDAIKLYIDKLVYFIRFLKIFSIKKTNSINYDNDECESLYNNIDIFIEEYSSIFSMYNSVRNYITKAVYVNRSEKLTFDCSSLLNGWDKNKIVDNRGAIIRRNKAEYYLLILKHGVTISRNYFENLKIDHGSSEWEWLEYKQLGGGSVKSLPKQLFGSKFSKSESKEKMKSRNIEFFKIGHLEAEYEKIFQWRRDNVNNKFSELLDGNSDMKKIYIDLYSDIDSQSYLANFKLINFSNIDEKVKNNDFYMFRIQNKDLIKKNHDFGTSNLHTIYWESLFHDNAVNKLNGNAEIFYRKAGEFINDNRSIITEKDHINITERNERAVHNARFRVDKYFLHVPITLNWKQNREIDINTICNEYIKHNDINLIGIDRGERNLLYYSVINMKGEIIKQGSMNKMNGKDYNMLLTDKSKERENARKNWDKIENIRNLKNGYMSNVTSYIANLMIKYNAVVVLEDLNSGFMRSRQKIEKSIYKKFEVALENKLHYLIIKGKKYDEPGGVNCAITFTPKVEGSYKNKYQAGMLLFVRPNYTSITDPVGNFRKDVYIKKGSKSKMFVDIKKYIKSIEWDSGYNSYKIEYSNGDKENARNYIVYTNVDRVVSDSSVEKKDYKDRKIMNMTDIYNKFFYDNNIDKNSNILDQITDKVTNKFLEDFIYMFNNVIQLRNTLTKDSYDYDFIQSPVPPFFDSRVYEKEGKNELDDSDNAKYPVSGDSNGAYNIARKGLIAIDDIRNDSGVKYIEDSRWDEFLDNNKIEYRSSGF